MIRSIQQYANRICRQINVPTSSTYSTTKIFEWLSARYRAIYTAQYWPKTIDFTNVTVPANVAEVTLPKKIGSVLRIVDITNLGTVYLIDAASYSDKTISLRNVFRIFLDCDFDDETPVGTALGTSNVLAQPPNPSVMQIVSSAAGDTTGSIYVRGLNATGDIVQDTIALNGTTPVNGTITFTQVDAVSKTVQTTGIVNISDTSANQIATIASYEVSPEYQRIKLEVTNTNADTLTVAYQRAFVPFLNSADVPVFDMEDALVHGATADAWREQKDFTAAAAEEALYTVELKNLVNRWFEKSGNALILMPSCRA